MTDDNTEITVDNYYKGMDDSLDFDVPKTAVPITNYEKKYNTFLNDKISTYKYCVQDEIQTIKRHASSIKNHKKGKYDYKYSDSKVNSLIEDHKKHIKQHIKSIQHLKCLIANEKLDKQDLSVDEMMDKVNNLKEDVQI